MLTNPNLTEPKDVSRKKNSDLSMIFFYLGKEVWSLKETKKWTHLHTCACLHNSLYYENQKLHLNFPYYMVQALHNRCQMSRISSKAVCYTILVCKKGALNLPTGPTIIQRYPWHFQKRIIRPCCHESSLRISWSNLIKKAGIKLKAIVRALKTKFKLN